jgi:hypothetical protein
MTFAKQVRFEDDQDSSYTEESSMYDETETLDDEELSEEEFTDVIKYDETVTEKYMENYPENCYHILYVIPEGFNPLKEEMSNNGLTDEMEDIMHEHMLTEGLFQKLHSRQTIIPHFVHMHTSDPRYWLSRMPNTYIPHRYDHICLMLPETTRVCHRTRQPQGFINWHIRLITNRFYKMKERHSIYRL